MKEWLLELEKSVYQTINLRMENPLFDAVFPWLEKEIHFLIPLFLLFGILFLLGKRRTKIFVLWVMIALVATYGFNSKIVKKIVKRERPHHTYQTGEFKLHLIHKEDAPGKKDYSFPSGHASFLFALALFITCYYPRLWVGIGMYLLAFLMGLSRIYVGVHYPLDILGAMVTGSLMAGIVFYLQYKLQGKEWYENLLSRITFTSPVAPAPKEGHPEV